MELAARYTSINAAEISSLIDDTEYTLCFYKYFSGHMECQADLSYHDRDIAEDDFLKFKLQVEFAL